MKRGLIIAIVLVILILGIIGFIYLRGSSKVNAPGETAVLIQNFAFNPAEITINSGETVTWTNKDAVVHDITLDNGLFDVDLNPDQSYSHVFTEKGIFDYHCDIHSSMRGKIIVT